MCALWAKLKSNSDQIGAASAIVGVLVGVAGFGFTYYQLSSATGVLQATNAYEIQKDARELVDGLASDADFVAALNTGPGQSDAAAFETKLWRMFSFYLSIYRQSTADGISKKFATSFADDFCGFIGKPVVAAEWDKMQQSGKLGDSHAEMRKAWCTP